MEEYARTRLIHSSCQIVPRSGRPIDKEEWLNQFLEDANLTNDLRRVDEEYFKKKRKLKQGNVTDFVFTFSMHQKSFSNF